MEVIYGWYSVSNTLFVWQFSGHVAECPLGTQYWIHIGSISLLPFDIAATWIHHCVTRGWFDKCEEGGQVNSAVEMLD